ncbi:hypothetical protein Bhyg_04485 [Pseudolycoriella hygida]|uniref:Uncharacterized protein n=1 Tax=Pseudolycoriella hygida TaxID=35572 RepID=A0A9Q0NGG9_9DIPT|nr:hypothetical protein Bhyg_04485 [Pseudolycoriella hygida]
MKLFIYQQNFNMIMKHEIEAIVHVTRQVGIKIKVINVDLLKQQKLEFEGKMADDLSSLDLQELSSKIRIYDDL